MRGAIRNTAGSKLFSTHLKNMDCPNCKKHLQVKRAISKPHNIYVWECPECGGWWLKSKNLEEYRASVLPTSQYTPLPKFELTSEQSPIQCCSCKHGSMMLYMAGEHIIRRCPECSGIFLSKEQILKIVQKKEDIFLDFMGDLGICTLLTGFFSN